MLSLWPVHDVGMLCASASEHTLVHAQPMDGSADETGIEELVKLFSGSRDVSSRLNQKMMAGVRQSMRRLSLTKISVCVRHNFLVG